MSFTRKRHTGLVRKTLRDHGATCISAAFNDN